jgi:hypothetical protein
VIAARDRLAMQHQIFFVATGSFDSDDQRVRLASVAIVVSLVALVLDGAPNGCTRDERCARELAGRRGYQQQCHQDFHRTFSELPFPAMRLQQPCQPRRTDAVAWNLLYPASS